MPISPRTTFIAALLSSIVALAARPAIVHAQDTALLPFSNFKLVKAYQRIAAGEAEVLADSDIYTEDRLAQFVALFSVPYGVHLRVELEKEGLGRIARQQSTATSTTIGDGQAIRFESRMATLGAGQYALRAFLLDRGGKTVETARVLRFKVESAASTSDSASTSDAAESIPLRLETLQTAWTGSYPVTVGVPFPRGMVSSAESLARFVVLENGAPVSAQWEVSSSTPDWGVRWAKVSFLANYVSGKPKTYLISSSLAQASNTLTPNAPTITPIPFTPYIIDEHGERFEGQAQPILEESGPIRTVYSYAGWFYSQTGQTFCKYTTRMILVRGQPCIIDHRVILTSDSRVRRIADAGVTFSAQNVTSKSIWTTNIDGKQRTGVGDMHVLQHRYDAVKLVAGAPSMPAVITNGKQSLGWLTYADSAIVLRDIWQRFPKELDVSGGRLTVHLWPAHGQESFSTVERTKLSDIYKLRYAHQGRLLDLTFPQLEFDALLHSDEKITSGGSLAHAWDGDDSIKKTIVSSSQGVAFSSTFAVFHANTKLGLAVTPTKIASFVKVFQQDPGAATEGSWFARTQVEPGVGATTSRAEEAYLESNFVKASNYIISSTNEYGMWIYANTHDNFDTIKNAAELHRAWGNSHYANISLLWQLFLRGGNTLSSWALRHLAIAQTRNFEDVGTVNFVSAETPVRFHALGAQHHTKAFLPWGGETRDVPVEDADAGLGFHFIDPDAFLYSSLANDDLTGRELYSAWRTSMLSRKDLPSGIGREQINTLAMLLSSYATTWDAQDLMRWRLLSRQALKTPWASYPNAASFPTWHQGWMQRYLAQTRDEKIVDVVKLYVTSYPSPAATAFLAWATRDETWLSKAAGDVFDLTHLMYKNPNDALDGWGPYVNLTALQTSRGLLYYLSAVEALGLSTIDGTSSSPLVLPTAARAETGLSAVKASAVSLQRDKRLWTINRSQGDIMCTSTALEPCVITFGTDAFTESPRPAYAQLLLGSKIVFETVVLAGSKRASLDVTLSPGQMYKFRTFSNTPFYFTWTSKNAVARLNFRSN